MRCEQFIFLDGILSFSRERNPLTSEDRLESGPGRIVNAKIALLQFCISPPKTDMEHQVVIHDYAAMDRILREEKKYIASICKKIKASGANVLLIQKSILRDAVTDLSLHYLAKMKIMVVTGAPRLLLPPGFSCSSAVFVAAACSRLLLLPIPGGPARTDPRCLRRHRA